MEKNLELINEVFVTLYCLMFKRFSRKNENLLNEKLINQWSFSQGVKILLLFFFRYFRKRWLLSELPDPSIWWISEFPFYNWKDTGTILSKLVLISDNKQRRDCLKII